jgi:hypothetical protein
VPAFTDVDNASLTYTATLGNGDALPHLAVVRRDHPDLLGHSAHQLRRRRHGQVTGSDGSLSASNTFTLDITPVNDAPVAVDIADKTSAEDEAFSFTVPASRTWTTPR